MQIMIIYIMTFVFLTISFLSGTSPGFLSRTLSRNNLYNDICFSYNFLSLRDESGVFISDIVTDSVAAKCGKLQRGDQILAVNGEDLRNASQERAALALRVSFVAILKLSSPKLFQVERERERRILKFWLQRRFIPCSALASRVSF